MKLICKCIIIYPSNGRNYLPDFKELYTYNKLYKLHCIIRNSILEILMANIYKTDDNQKYSR